MRYLLTIMLSLMVVAQVQAEELTSRDFASGYYLEVSKTGPMHGLQLPEDVYRTVTRADLGDIRVFNGAGEIVPHGFRPVETDAKEEREQEKVPFFPLYASNGPTLHSDMALRVKPNNQGIIVNIESGAGKEEGSPLLTGYLLDLSGLKQRPGVLEFFWQKKENIDSSIYVINIQQSNDLERWTSFVQKATLADLEYGGQRIERRKVTLPYKPQKYLKITWQGSGEPLKLVNITSLSKVIESRVKRQWVSLNNGSMGEAAEQTVIDYKTRYHLPVNSVQVNFPENNSLARLAVQSRSGEDASWVSRCEKVFYNLQLEGSAMANEPCSVRSNSDSLWRIVVQQDGAGLGAGKKTPTLRLGWSPNEMFFVARGSGPYLLAFGSGKLMNEAEQKKSGMILQAFGSKTSSQMISTAGIGKKVTLSGDKALQPPPEPVQWKSWLLWAVLIIGVGLLAYMARSLSKEIKKAEEK